MGLRKRLHRHTPAEDGEPLPDIADWLAHDEPRLIRRAMFDTVVMNHPAGTLVTPVTVGRDLPPSVSQ